MCWISIEKQNNESTFQFITASQDQSIIQWEWSLDNNKVNKIVKCIGHTESVECIDVNHEKAQVINKINYFLVSYFSSNWFNSSSLVVHGIKCSNYGTLVTN